MARQILVIGDSHTRSLKSAVASDAKAENVRVHWLNTGKGAAAANGDITREEAVTAVEELGPDDLLVIGFFGAYHNALGLFEDATPFDVMTPEETDVEIENGVQLMPYNVLKSVYAEKLAAKHPTLSLVPHAKCKVVCTMTPPPKDDDDLWRARLLAKNPGQTINPAPRRRRLWQVEGDVVAAHLKEHNVELLLPPEGTMNADRFLGRDFWHSDAQHANERYGALVLSQIRAL